MTTELSGVWWYAKYSTDCEPGPFCDGAIPAKKIHWVTPPTSFTSIRSNYVVYADESDNVFLNGYVNNSANLLARFLAS